MHCDGMASVQRVTACCFRGGSLRADHSSDVASTFALFASRLPRNIFQFRTKHTHLDGGSSMEKTEKMAETAEEAKIECPLFYGVEVAVIPSNTLTGYELDEVRTA